MAETVETERDPKALDRAFSKLKLKKAKQPIAAKNR